jgi:hypothetical protein
MAKAYHHSPATAWRVTVESWLRRQRLISIRQNQKQKVSVHFSEILVSELPGPTLVQPVPAKTLLEAITKGRKAGPRNGSLGTKPPLISALPLR